MTADNTNESGSKRSTRKTRPYSLTKVKMRALPPTYAPGSNSAIEEARRAGLLEGESTEHVSFRAPKALVEAAKRQSGASKPTELGLLALATLAQPDPTAAFMKQTFGALGADHKLDY